MGGVDFDAARRERQAAVEAYTFTLGGETFAVRTELALGELWVDEAPAAPERFAPKTKNGTSFLAMARTISSHLSRDDWERWWSIFDPPTDVQGADLIGVLDALTEVITGRPFFSSNASANGPPTNDSANGSTSKSKPAEISDARSSTRRAASASRGSNGTRTNGHPKAAKRTSLRGSKAKTKN